MPLTCYVFVKERRQCATFCANGASGVKHPHMVFHVNAKMDSTALCISILWRVILGMGGHENSFALLLSTRSVASLRCIPFDVKFQSLSSGKFHHIPSNQISSATHESMQIIHISSI